MEKETFDFIVGLLVVITAILGMGIAFYLIYAIRSSRKRQDSYGKTVLGRKMDYVPCSKQFKKLWEDSGLYTFYDMDGANSSKLNINNIQKDIKLAPRYDDEEIYRDAILGLMKDGSKYRSLNKNDLELRKFCIEHTSKGLKMIDKTKEADILYNYINTGKTKSKED